MTVNFVQADHRETAAIAHTTTELRESSNMIITRELQLRTQGHTTIEDVTDRVQAVVAESGLAAGIVTIFCPGSTAGLTTLEYEDGVVADLRRVFDEITPPERAYQHHLRWGDDNGSAHVRAALIGPSLVVPFAAGRLALGTWQQIVFLDFDTSPRTRRLVVQVMGE